MQLNRWSAGSMVLVLAAATILSPPAAAQRQQRRKDDSRRMMKAHRNAKDTAPKVGDDAPNFKLAMHDGDKDLELTSLRGKKPVVLVFGSYTCPPFRHQVKALIALKERYGDVAAFYVIYIKEAHAADSRRPIPIKGEEAINEPTSLEERKSVASKCMAKLNLDVPCLVDDMDNTTSTTYNAGPDRIFVVDEQGKIAVRAEAGPRGFGPGVQEATKWLATHFPDRAKSLG